MKSQRDNSLVRDKKNYAHRVAAILSLMKVCVNNSVCILELSKYILGKLDSSVSPERVKNQEKGKLKIAVSDNLRSEHSHRMGGGGRG